MNIGTSAYAKNQVSACNMSVTHKSLLKRALTGSIWDNLSIIVNSKCN